MYTVIIAEQEHIDNIREYSLFLEPFMSHSEVAFCQWKPELADVVRESVPGLENTVFQREDWRAVILCDERGLNQKNPFDIVKYKPSVWDERDGESMEDFYSARIAARKSAYRRAAEEPLVRLVTMLCEDPLIRKRDKGEENDIMRIARSDWETAQRLTSEKLTEDDTGGETRPQEPLPEDLAPASMQAWMEFLEYRDCARCKQEIRDEIRGEEPVRFALPREIICIAKRHDENPDNTLRYAWSGHDEREYSRFYDWNMYYDKMRYLVYDIDEKTRQSYTGGYIRFLLSVLLVAGHEIPAGCLAPNRVYNLRCEDDEEQMAQLLERYNGKLEATKEKLRAEIGFIRSRQVERLTDDQAERIFCADINIPINFQNAYDEEELYCTDRFGLSSDCPVDNEETVFDASCAKNRAAMKKLLRQPERAVKRATDDFRKMNILDEERAAVLNEYQVDDVREYVNLEEKRMVETFTNNIYDVQEYEERMERGEEGVREVIGTRMRRRMTIFWGVLCLAVVALGSLPMLLMNRMESPLRLPVPASVLLLIAGLAAVAVVVVICLFVLRGKLLRRVTGYNDNIRSIADELHGDINRYSEYLSHACNVMRGNSVIRYYEEHEDGDVRLVTIMQKHVSDLEERQAVLNDVFGRILNRGAGRPDPRAEAPYDLDFSRASDYDYPLPSAPDMETRIEFLERGNYVNIPYGIVKSIEVGREELYD